MFCSQCGARAVTDARFCVGCGAQVALAADAGAGVVSVTSNAFSPAPSKDSAETRHAGFWYRVLAALIDTILCQVVVFIIAFIVALGVTLPMAETSTGSELEAIGGGVGFLVGIVIQWLWFTIPESSNWQGSPGKKLLGLKVTDEQGRRIGFGRANARYWSKILSAIILCIGFLMVAFTEKKQGLHDKIAETLVIKA